ncbi:MAG: MipA/OmpV family protein [Xanthomonadales bacterium]|nr:MipA/OmpV family protein [Xanthomonadales bacterium]
MSHHRPSFLPWHLLLGAGCVACVAWPQPGRAATEPVVLALGAGVQRMPSWPGASSHRQTAVPYFDFEWPGHVSLSTQDGLHVDLVDGRALHSGVYGNYQWGRDSDDLGALRGHIATLAPRLTLGGYLEWQLTKRMDAGSDLSHDINGAGAYFRLYAEFDLPAMGLLQHSIAVSWQAMNRAAMRRYFGIAPAQAETLAVEAWQPGAGSQLAELEYEVFLPTSQHTGLAAAISWGRLLGGAAASPLVTRFGSRNQLSESVAFVYHL